MISFFSSISQKFRILLSGLYLITMVVLSLMPSEDIPDLELFNGFDKLVHFCLYLGFAWLVSWALYAERKSTIYSIIFILCISWGVLMETFQYIMHFGRSFEWVDVIFNASGTMTGLFLYYWMFRKIPLLKKIK